MNDRLIDALKNEIPTIWICGIIGGCVNQIVGMDVIVGIVSGWMISLLTLVLMADFWKPL